MLVDLHVHARPDGAAPEALLDRAVALELDGVAVVADDAFADTWPLRDEAKTRGVLLLSGAELATDRGHFLVFLPRPETLPPVDEIFGQPGEHGFSLRDVALRTHVLGGALVAAHPYDKGTPRALADAIYTVRHLTAVEAVNGDRGYPTGRGAIEAADALGLPCIGGSDARALDDVGRAATLFGMHVSDEASLVEALKAGACWPVEFASPPGDLERRNDDKRESRRHDGPRGRDDRGRRRRR